MDRRHYAVLAPVSRGYPPLEGRLVTCYSPGRHFTHGLLHFLVRLACVRHAASVDSEPGSNSRLKPEICSRRNRLAIPQSGRHECPHSTERPYFVSTLGLEPEPFHTVAGHQSLVAGKAHDRRQRSATDSFNWHVQPICQRP